MKTTASILILAIVASDAAQADPDLPDEPAPIVTLCGTWNATVSGAGVDNENYRQTVADLITAGTSLPSSAAGSMNVSTSSFANKITYLGNAQVDSSSGAGFTLSASSSGEVTVVWTFTGTSEEAKGKVTSTAKGNRTGSITLVDGFCAGGMEGRVDFSDTLDVKSYAEVEFEAATNQMGSSGFGNALGYYITIAGGGTVTGTPTGHSIYPVPAVIYPTSSNSKCVDSYTMTLNARGSGGLGVAGADADMSLTGDIWISRTLVLSACCSANEDPPIPQ